MFSQCKYGVLKPLHVYYRKMYYQLMVTILTMNIIKHFLDIIRERKKKEPKIHPKKCFYLVLCLTYVSSILITSSLFIWVNIHM